MTNNKNNNLCIGDLVYFDIIDFDVSGFGILVKIEEDSRGYGYNKKTFRYCHISKSNGVFVVDARYIRKINLREQIWV